jgi:hypothetical protein
MKPMPALALIAVGAILAFAVRAPGGVISFSSAGWVLILTGLAGVLLPYLLPQRWVQRRVIRRGGAGRMPMGWTFRRRPNPSLATVPPPVVSDEVLTTEESPPVAGTPAEEVVEEIYEE